MSRKERLKVHMDAYAESSWARERMTFEEFDELMEGYYQWSK